MVWFSHLCHSSMKIMIITPAPAGSRKGNRITALRWAGLLRKLGHQVSIRTEYVDERCALLIAMHAGRSFDAVRSFRRSHGERPVIVALTGTDLYDEIRRKARARRTLEMASRLVVLQSLGVEELPAPLRRKTEVIFQSTVVPRVRPK